MVARLEVTVNSAEVVPVFNVDPDFEVKKPEAYVYFSCDPQAGLEALETLAETYLRARHELMDHLNLEGVDDGTDKA